MIRMMVMMAGSVTGLLGFSGEASAFGGRLFHRGVTCEPTCEPTCQPATQCADPTKPPKGYVARTVMQPYTYTVQVPHTVMEAVIGPDGKPLIGADGKPVMRSVTVMKSETKTGQRKTTEFIPVEQAYDQLKLQIDNLERALSTDTEDDVKRKRDKAAETLKPLINPDK